jgi:hypothetical protein
LGDLGILVDRKIILNWILKKEDMRMWTRFIRLRIGIIVMNHQDPWDAGNSLTTWVTISFSKNVVLHGVNKLQL